MHKFLSNPKTNFSHGFDILHFSLTFCTIWKDIKYEYAQQNIKTSSLSFDRDVHIFPKIPSQSCVNIEHPNSWKWMKKRNETKEDRTLLLPASYGYRLSADRERTKNRTTVRRDWEIPRVGKWRKRVKDWTRRENGRGGGRDKTCNPRLIRSSLVYVSAINSVIRRKTDNSAHSSARNIRGSINFS